MERDFLLLRKVYTINSLQLYQDWNSNKLVSSSVSTRRSFDSDDPEAKKKTKG